MARRVWEKSIWTVLNGCGFNCTPEKLAQVVAWGITDIRCLKCGADWKPDAARPRKCKGDTSCE